MPRHYPAALRALLAILALLATMTVVHAQDWQVGDRVQAFNVDWYDGTITEIGTGDRAGTYLVKWDAFAAEQYIAAANIRPLPNASTPSTLISATDLPGRYVCYGYPGPNGQFRWYLDLTDGGYAQRTPDLPAGNYGYDAEDSAIMFLDGPYANAGWYGQVSADRIVLRAIASERQGPRVDEYANIYCSR